MFTLSRNLCADTFLIIYLKIITILVQTTVKKKSAEHLSVVRQVILRMKCLCDS